MSLRFWLSIITLCFIAAIIYFSREQILFAWELLSTINIWLLLLLIPGQIIVYYAAGEMIFSYLRSKGSIKHINGFNLARMALEMNFVNHILPSAGVSGISYMNWRLNKEGVSYSRATMAQVVRFAIGFIAFIILLAISVVIVTIDHGINRWILFFSMLIAGGMIISILLGIYLFNSKIRSRKFAIWLTNAVNKIVKLITLSKKNSLMNRDQAINYFEELHKDYLFLKKDKKILIKPLIWGIILIVFDILLFMICFLALGSYVNPAIILIAYGLAAGTAFFMITPGGAGAYEAVMVSFLVISGISNSLAIAGILLTRVILLLGTILFGYFFYQHALIKYGKKRSRSNPKS